MTDLRERQKLRQDFQAMADEIMRDRDLTPVKVVFNKRLTVTAGRYNHEGREVQLGSWILDSPSDALDVFLHEMAHAVTTQVTPKAAAHGIQWKRQCRELGANPIEHYNLTNPMLALKANAKRRPLVTYFKCKAPARFDPCEMRYRNKPRKDLTSSRFYCRDHGQPFVRTR